MKELKQFYKIRGISIRGAKDLNELKGVIRFFDTVNGLIELVERIESDFSGVEEGSDAEVLDDAINDCMLSINTFKMSLKEKGNNQ